MLVFSFDLFCICLSYLHAVSHSVAVPSGVGHAISACTGLYILYVFFHSTMLYIVIFATAVYFVLWLLSKMFKCRRGPIMGIVSIFLLIIW